jgi:hypothetical protein
MFSYIGMKGQELTASSLPLAFKMTSIELEGVY